MQVTREEDSFLKRKSQALQIPFSNLLRGYVIERLLFHIYTSDYKEYLWLMNEQDIGVDAYGKGKEAPLRFAYHKSEKKSYKEGIVPGSSLSQELLQDFLEKELYPVTAPIQWMGEVIETEEGFGLSLRARVEDMTIPIHCTFVELENNWMDRGSCILEMLENEHPLTIYTYSSERNLCKSLYEILDRMELVKSMEVFETVDLILKTEAVSGRHIREELLQMRPFEERFYRQKRMEQLKSYRNYTYMRKRWEQYQKKSGKDKDSWELVMGRLISFLEPIWTALCNQEIFFDDWMPDLERFLG